MTELLHELPQRHAARAAATIALRHKTAELSYGELASRIDAFAAAAIALDCQRGDRIGIFLPKQFENVIAMFGTTRAGCVFVPINPLLKPPQVQHILMDCNVRVLVTSPERFELLRSLLAHCPDLRHVVVIGDTAPASPSASLSVVTWQTLLAGNAPLRPYRVIDADMAAILYTSGSTGKPKGVVLSHSNIVTGAHSVAQYLENTANDRLLAVLPFSFDYGFSQLSTSFHAGASVVLMDYLFPRDILTLLARERITGLAGVPPLWSQLAELEWPADITSHLRYITNSGGALPGATLRKLRDALPRTQVFLMYGLTEAFRSTYLPPTEIDNRPGSMGKAIPNAEILVVRPDGTPCAPNEPGELVHRGSLVALGYWNDSDKTALRFRPAPGQPAGLRLPEIAVWSGDTVRADEDGFLYFVGRGDEMIKTSGYRVSPTEVEEVVFASGLVADAAAVGVKHPTLGQAIVIVATPAAGHVTNERAVLDHCRKELPAFMVPTRIEWRDALPRNPNGKYDRPRLATELADLFAGPPA
jgi:acyl-CoA ligase (AMP-forming) (exosortase A-associated)